MDPARVLLVDDDPNDLVLVGEALRQPDGLFSVDVANGVADAREKLSRSRFDVVVADYRLGDGDGVDLVQDAGTTPVVVVTGAGSEDVAVQALRAGAHDYLIKDAAGRFLSLLAPTIERVLARCVAERTALERGIELAVHKEARLQLERYAETVANALSLPLRTTAHYCDLILGQRVELDAMTRAYAVSAARGARRAELLVAGLLSYSRCGVTWFPTEVDMASLVSQVLEDQGQLIREVGAEIEVGALESVAADSEHLRTVLNHLIRNALQHRGERPPKVRIEGQRRRDHVEFRISDNGPGVGPEDAVRVFELFLRGRNAEDKDGAGIGLAVCRKLIERNGGSIWLEPSPDHGAAFCFALPAPVRG